MVGDTDEYLKLRQSKWIHIVSLLWSKWKNDKLSDSIQ